ETILPSSWVEQVLNSFRDNPDQTVLVGTGYFYNLRASWLTNVIINNSFRFAKLLLGHYPLWGPNFIVKRTVWLNIKDRVNYSPSTYDDLDAALLLHATNQKIEWDKQLKVG